jgi:hypothetical protein
MKVGLTILGIPIIGMTIAKGEGDGETISVGAKRLVALVQKGVNSAAIKVAEKTEDPQEQGTYEV